MDGVDAELLCSFDVTWLIVYEEDVVGLGVGCLEETVVDFGFWFSGSFLTGKNGGVKTGVVLLVEKIHGWLFGVGEKSDVIVLLFEMAG